jgi:hypothetical protein
VKPHEIENWALSVIKRVESRQPIEDSRVELKSSWPEAPKAARRIAGHANAARGEPILWLIGIDEKKGIIKGAAQEDMANWFQEVKSQFDGLPPTVTDLNVPVEGTTVVALLFETDRAPFVVKNPEGGAIQFEVPWRENTSIRSANRSDLMMLLSPLQKLPSFEVLNGKLIQGVQSNLYIDEQKPGWHFQEWHLQMKLYITPGSDTRIVIPFHRCEASFEIAEVVERTFFEHLRLEPDGVFSPHEGFVSHSLTIQGTNTEVLINGPGMLNLSAFAVTPATTKQIKNDACVMLHLLPADSKRMVEISSTLVHMPSNENKLGIWEYQKFE